MKKTVRFVFFYSLFLLATQSNAQALRGIPECGLDKLTHSVDVTKLRSMKLATFNMERIFHINGRPKEEWKRGALADRIFEMNPDFLILNDVEGYRAVEKFNRKYLENSYDVHAMPANMKLDSRELVVSLLVAKDLNVKVEVENLSSEVWYPDGPNTTPKNLFIRDSVFVVRDGFNPEKVIMVIVGVHLKSLGKKPGAMDPKIVRDAQIERIGEIVQRLQKQYGDKVVVAGDFNKDLDDKSEYAPIYSKGLVNSLVTNQIQIPKNQRISFSYFHPNGTPEHDQIDGILIPASWENSIEEAAVLRHINPRNNKEFDLPRQHDDKHQHPSDHNPIYTKLKAGGILK